MHLQPQKILKELEEIKVRLIHLELTVVGTEKPGREDVKAVKEALKEYKNGKTIPFGS
jgi:hypothetical protein